MKIFFNLGNESNQQLLSSIQMSSSLTSSTHHCPLINTLLLTMINEKQAFLLRCSILYLFECFLYKNESKKTHIVESLIKQQQQQENDIGQILCSGLFQVDFVSNWLCACSLSHCVRDNTLLKEKLLSLNLSINIDNNNKHQEMTSLMQQCMNVLIRSETGGNDRSENDLKFQTKCAFLMFLSTWLANCPKAVGHFLLHKQNILHVSDFFSFVSIQLE
jgi:hypothetical protein